MHATFGFSKPQIRKFQLIGASLVLACFGLLPSAGIHAAAGGNNGTLKVHEIGTPSGTESNDPKVCAFNFEGFSFDPSQSGYITIDGQGQTSGTYGAFAFGPTDALGYAISQDFNNGAGTVTIPDGQYKATLYGKDAGGNIDLTDTKAKSKVFKIECAPVPTTGTLIVKKHVINDDGGTSVASDFTMNVTGTNVSNPSFAGDENGVTVTLDAGSYNVDETVHSDYAETKSADCSGTIAAGETKTCTITNNDIAPGQGGGGGGTGGTGGTGGGGSNGFPVIALAPVTATQPIVLAAAPQTLPVTGAAGLANIPELLLSAIAGLAAAFRRKRTA